MSRRGRTWLGTLMLALYPEPWRARYGDEVAALLDDDPPGAGGLASMIFGAADAHLRPQRSWRDGLAPAAAMRLSVGGLFVCWVLVSVAGVGFVQQTEGLSPVESAHPILEVAHGAIFAGALIGAASLLVGGLPLIFQAIAAALSRRDRRLAWLLAAPTLAVGLFAAFAALLMALAPQRQTGFPASYVLEILLPVTLAGLACALVCALAPKAAMRRAQPGVPLLRLACRAGQALTIAVCLVCAGLAVYVPKLWTVSTAIGAEASGPFGASTRATLSLSLAAALLACGLALVAARRARMALAGV
jgi:hypothetical protein